jgi:hypothetical protein
MTKLSNVLDGNAEAATDRRVTFLVFLFLLSIYLLMASLRIGSGDGETIYRVTRSLVEEKSFAIPSPPLDAVVVDSFGEPIPPEQLRGGGPYGAWGTDGRYYAQYGVGQSLLAAPLYLLGRGFHRLTGWGAEGFVTRAAVTLLNPLALALTGGAVFCLARWLGYGRGAAVGVALVVTLATPLWVYSKAFFGEPLVALALVVAVLAALRGDGGAMSGWVACGTVLGAAVLVKPVVLVVVAPFFIFAVLRKKGRWRALALMAGPLAVALLGVGAYNAVRFGSPLDTGYRTAAWDVPFWAGLAGLILSPGKGLLWYCPPVALGVAGFVPLARRRLRAATLMGGVAVLYLLVHSIYNHWHGGGAWGPRLILPIVPLLILPAAAWFQHPPRRAWAQLALAVLLAAGMIIQLPAVLVHPARTLQALYDRSASPTEYTLRLLYRPADSPLVGQWRSLLEVAALMRDPATRAMVVEAASAAGEEAGQDRLTSAAGYLAFNAFDLWPVYWGLLGAPVLFLLALEGGLAVLAGWVAWRLWKETT